MKKLVVLALLSMMSLSVLTACDTQKQEPVKRVEDENIEKADTKDIKGIHFVVEDDDLIFPYDFTREALKTKGYVADKTFEQFIVKDNELISITYGTDLNVLYYPKDMVVTSTDSMFMTGFNLKCEGKKVVMDGIDLSTPPEGTVNNLFEYETDDCFVSVNYIDGKLSSIKTVVNRPDDYYQYKESAKILNTLPYEKAFNEEGKLTYRVGDVLYKTYPSEDIPRVLSYTEIPFSVAYTNDVPSVCIKKTKAGSKEVGILLSEENMSVNDIAIGGSFLDLQKEVGLKEDSEVTLLELTSESCSSKVYVESEDGLTITNIALVIE